MQDEDLSLWDLAKAVLMFAVLPCAIITGGAYLYVLYLKPPPYAGVTLQPGVVYVSARRFETQGLERLAANGESVDLTPWWPGDQRDTHLKPDVTVLVHGYNAQEHKVATYFTELAAHLQSEGGYDGTIVVFDWPALGTPLDELPTAQRVQLDMNMMGANRPSQASYELAMYGLDQRQAQGIGARSFLALLDLLSTSGAHTINVVAHSMGCYLVAEALKLRPGAATRIASMIWLAPDIDEAVTDAPWLRTAVDRLQNGLTVLYSRSDTVLTRLSRLANGTERLGATGAGTHTPPSKMVFVDMTAELGTENAHTGYLMRGSSSLQRIARQLSAAAPAP
ncbi:alpha/beta fold hydrolase [Hyphomicrobium sp. CS1GBMeth3]|uniref:alpha/beta fold hydrolase n=1 Tax=Hyphomicrobium sp. CS1GBMeth3 TaxID=1892845 RepID=UPI000930FAC8|nr:alpha/beta fold hydrolase [Hyphomicrobium sp. CS1GBMeth3]